MSDEYDLLKLGNQLCFPLYACSREIVKKYKPYLDQIDLTYTQYITMMVMWEVKKINVKDLGECLFLDSGTLTPVLKKLETKGLVNRRRDTKDERVLLVTITDEGEELKKKAVMVPKQVASCLSLDRQDSKELARILNKIMLSFKD